MGLKRQYKLSSLTPYKRQNNCWLFFYSVEGDYKVTSLKQIIYTESDDNALNIIDGRKKLVNL